MIFLDTNVATDLITATGEWSEWSTRQVDARTRDAALVCNLIVVAEIAAGLRDGTALLDDLSALSIDLVDLDAATAFRAADAQRMYRRRGGPRQTILPDFLIAAHAVTLGAHLMTRDRRLAGYFPDLTLITPETHP